MTRSRRLRSAAISFDFGDGRVRRNKIIDTRLSTVLFALMGQAVGEPTSLATRNLLRSLAVQVPSGQRVAKAMEVPALADADLVDLAPFKLQNRTPLWFYVLREAHVVAEGRHLGPVGGRIVAEVLVGLIGGDRFSCLRQDPDWTPTYGSGDEFTVPDLLLAFHPYLFFGGDCRDAFTRYQEIFGGELTLITMKDVPGEEPPADKADMIIHAALTIGDDLLMASDDPMTDDFGPVQGMMVSYDAADVADAKRVFDALTDGGNVTQTLGPTFFSEAFGMCVDRFGTPWMVVGPQPQQPS